MKYNNEQLLIALNHIGASESMTKALRYHLMEGMTMYSAEKKAGLTKNSLRKKVIRVEREIDYIQRFNAAATAEFQQSLDI